jgi:hypothetical protein
VTATTQEFNPATAIYTPSEVATYGKRAIEEIKQNQERALKFFIPGIADYFAPMLPGQLCGVIAQTSNYKTGFLYAWQEFAAKQLEAEGRTDEIIIHVSVEETIEEQAYLLLGIETGEDAGDLAQGQVQDWDRLEQAAVKIGTIPIYRIGDSLARADEFHNLYLSNMARAIMYLRDEILEGKKKIAAIFWDYLQAFPYDPEVQRYGNKEAQRRLQVREDIYRLKRAHAVLKCPGVVAVQAKQILSDTANKSMYIPGKYDGEESSAIGQRLQRIISLWMPKNNWPVGQKIDYGDLTYTVEESLLWVKVCKQQGRLPSGRGWPCRVDFQRNRILVSDGLM